MKGFHYLNGAQSDYINSIAMMYNYIYTLMSTDPVYFGYTHINMGSLFFESSLANQIGVYCLLQSIKTLKNSI